MVARTRLIATLDVHCLFCFSLVTYKDWNREMRYTGCSSKNDFTNFQMSSAHKKKTFPINVCLHTFSFRGTASTFAQPQSCRFWSMGTVQSIVYSPIIEHEGTQYQLTLGACQTIVPAPGTVTVCDSLSMHTGCVLWIRWRMPMNYMLLHF